MIRSALFIFIAVTVGWSVIYQHHQLQGEQAALAAEVAREDALRSARERYWGTVRNEQKDALNLELQSARKHFEAGRVSTADWELKQEDIQKKLARVSQEYEDRMAE